MPDLVRPTLLSSCRSAATKIEAGFRVDYPNSRTRASRIFALDERAAAAMSEITEAPWQGAHFLTVAETGDAEFSLLSLKHPDGSAGDLEAEMAGADVAVLLATSSQNVGAAEAIAFEARKRNIMVLGLALTDQKSRKIVDEVVRSMRLFASVLVVASDEEYIPAMLTALRA